MIGSLPSSKQRSKCKSMACKKHPKHGLVPASTASGAWQHRIWGANLSVCNPWGFQAASKWNFPFCLHLWMAKIPDFLARSQERHGEGWVSKDPAAPSGKSVHMRFHWGDKREGSGKQPAGLQHHHTAAALGAARDCLVPGNADFLPTVLPRPQSPFVPFQREAVCG